MSPAVVLRREREHAGLTQAELAEKAGTSQAKISAYETGRISPSWETMSRLLAALGARLAVERSRAEVTIPSRRQQARTSRQLVEVLGLAAALPNEHEPESRFPRLPVARRSSR